ncbi:MAG: hypothetical protein OEZ43_18965 [Gammaproteobacteria bacterium]|nr:hypothetical protein [Gammaproteobacteria bacterium]
MSQDFNQLAETITQRFRDGLRTDARDYLHRSDFERLQSIIAESLRQEFSELASELELFARRLRKSREPVELGM